MALLSEYFIIQDSTMYCPSLHTTHTCAYAYHRLLPLCTVRSWCKVLCVIVYFELFILMNIYMYKSISVQWDSRTSAFSSLWLPQSESVKVILRSYYLNVIIHWIWWNGCFLSLNSHPDVMIEAYKSDGSSAIFFIIFLVITLYLLTNVVCN